MTRAYLAVLTAFCACPAPGAAHALDEYLQATRLAFFDDRIVVELDLTPGVAVAAEVFARIDRDDDGRVVPPDVESYASHVVRDLSLSIDGRDYPLTLVRAEAPSWTEIRDGEGTLRLEAVARATLQPGSHRIRYDNRHALTANDVFLVNVLVPSTPAIAIGAQRRDRLQHGVDVDVAIDAVAPLHAAAWWLLPVAGLAALLVRRRRGPTALTGFPQADVQ